MALQVLIAWRGCAVAAAVCRPRALQLLPGHRQGQAVRLGRHLPRTQVSDALRLANACNLWGEERIDQGVHNKISVNWWGREIVHV